jgi:hypothetical protein
MNALAHEDDTYTFPGQGYEAALPWLLGRWKPSRRMRRRWLQQERYRARCMRISGNRHRSSWDHWREWVNRQPVGRR